MIYSRGVWTGAIASRLAPTGFSGAPQFSAGASLLAMASAEALHLPGWSAQITTSSAGSSPEPTVR